MLNKSLLGLDKVYQTLGATRRVSGRSDLSRLRYELRNRFGDIPEIYRIGPLIPENDVVIATDHQKIGLIYGLEMFLEINVFRPLNLLSLVERDEPMEDQDSDPVVVVAQDWKSGTHLAVSLENPDDEFCFEQPSSGVQIDPTKYRIRARFFSTIALMETDCESAVCLFTSRAPAGRGNSLSMLEDFQEYCDLNGLTLMEAKNKFPGAMMDYHQKKLIMSTVMELKRTDETIALGDELKQKMGTVR